ncbi:MAG: hypothetical protein IAC13_06190 [Firmicutes bacterium]|uniref:Uncharacterized protein n=1 Tax=Candidatus Scybalomonas excrementavium TaxID=2840943 RepID=A0A9D9I037_9FIRM|nr:hypothetical protein [Candidatus Scybalomonas excrementavium]
MWSFLNTIRCKEKQVPVRKQIIDTGMILFLGIVLGIFSKFLDTTASNDLPFMFEYLDVGNFLGRLAIWILLAVSISIYSSSSVRAAINVFLFFGGMCVSYHVYTVVFAGFNPRSYMMIWYGITILSPMLAFVCWYAKGKGNISFVFSAIILAVLFNLTFAYGWIYFDVRSILELITFICGVVVLKRNTLKESIIMLVSGIVIAFILRMIVPFIFVI